MSVVNLFYASDKAIYDALLQHKYTNADIKDIFLSRGILVSKETAREDLALYFSRLNHDYYDHQSIAKVLGVGHRKEKTSITNVNNKFSKEALEKVAMKIKEGQEAVGDVVKSKLTKNGMELSITYTQIDHNKSEFKQVIEREAVITIEIVDDSLAIRWPHNEYVEKIKECLLDELNNSDELTEDLAVEEIELSGINSPELRTAFFMNLCGNMNGFIMHDVTDADVYHPKLEHDGEEDIGVHIFKAALKGEGVHNSEELSSLYKKGFYLSKIVWIAKTESYESDLYELEAQFTDAENCKKFSYLVKGFYKYKGSGDYNKHRTSLPLSEEIRIGRLMESAARAAIKQAEADVGLG